jgi:hypothetical protein
MKNEDAVKDAVKAMADKSKSAIKSEDAMRFAQAALNLAHTAQTLAHTAQMLKHVEAQA